MIALSGGMYIQKAVGFPAAFFLFWDLCL